MDKSRLSSAGVTSKCTAVTLSRLRAGVTRSSNGTAVTGTFEDNR